MPWQIARFSNRHKLAETWPASNQPRPASGAGPSAWRRSLGRTSALIEICTSRWLQDRQRSRRASPSTVSPGPAAAIANRIPISCSAPQRQPAENHIASAVANSGADRHCHPGRAHPPCRSWPVDPPLGLGKPYLPASLPGQGSFRRLLPLSRGCALSRRQEPGTMVTWRGGPGHLPWRLLRGTSPARREGPGRQWPGPGAPRQDIISCTAGRA